MRWLVLFALAFTTLAARTASAAEAPATPIEEPAPAPKGPIEQPEDWIAVVGIVCYSVLPIVAIVTITYLTYRFFVNQSEAALLPHQRSDWLFRGASAIARPPPRGLVLLRF